MHFNSAEESKSNRKKARREAVTQHKELSRHGIAILHWFVTNRTNNIFNRFLLHQVFCVGIDYKTYHKFSSPSSLLLLLVEQKKFVSVHTHTAYALGLFLLLSILYIT